MPQILHVITPMGISLQVHNNLAYEIQYLLMQPRYETIAPKRAPHHILRRVTLNHWLS
jgi:hypothetical protein